ncbi:MAG: hypothetical protein MJ206_02680 [Bacilli bacterium]|nr:hypothetical protein [Bacilli bacterium]
MHIFVDKKIRNQLIRLTLLFSFIELIGVLIGTINTLMLGPTLDPGVAENTIAAVGFASQIFLFLNVVMSALVFISNTFYSQHYGRGDIPQVEKDFYFCQKLSIFIGVLFFVLSMAIPEQLIAIFAKSGQEEVIRIGANYLRIFSISFLFIPSIKMNYSLVKNTRLEREATIIAVATLSLVVILNSIFLYGLRLGPLGAALSIVIARFAELIATTVIIRAKCVVQPHFVKIFYPDFTRFKTSSKLMAPVFIGKTLWGLGTLAGVVVIGLFNDTELNAANQLMMTAQNLVSSFSTGIAIAAGVIVGRELGADRLVKVKETGHDILKFGALFGVILIVVFLLFLPFFYLLNRSLSETAVIYMVVLFLIQAGMFIPRVYNSIIVNGMLYTGGDTIFPCAVDGLAYWITVIPLSIVALKLNWHPIVPIILVQLEEVVKVGFFYYRYRKFKWVKNLTNKGGFVFK